MNQNLVIVVTGNASFASVYDTINVIAGALDTGDEPSIPLTVRQSLKEQSEKTKILFPNSIHSISKESFNYNKTLYLAGVIDASEALKKSNIPMNIPKF